MVCLIAYAFDDEVAGGEPTAFELMSVRDLWACADGVGQWAQSMRKCTMVDFFDSTTIIGHIR